MGEAALSGNLSAVGLLELLRIPMTTGRTGTLIVVNSDPDVPDAEGRLHYRDGTLVAGSLGGSVGEEALRRMIGWKDGYFEFLADTAPPESIDPRLHSAALTEIKNWYTTRTSSVRAAAAGSGASPQAIQVPRASPPASPKPELRPTPLRAVPPPKARPSAAIGSGYLDARGNLAQTVGTLTPRDGALAFAALQLAAAIGKEMVLGAPQSVEVRARGERWLGALAREDSSVVVVCPPETDLADELSRK